MNKNDLTYAAFLDALRVIQAEGLTPFRAHHPRPCRRL